MWGILSHVTWKTRKVVWSNPVSRNYWIPWMIPASVLVILLVIAGRDLYKGVMKTRRLSNDEPSV